MSDIFSSGDNLGDAGFLDTSSPTGGDAGSSGSIFTSGSSVIPGFTSSGGFDPGSTFSIPDSIFSSITAPQNLPASTGAGVGGALSDLSNLVTRFYAGVTQATMAKSAADLAQARAANALQTVKTTPNVWLVGGLVVAGFFALEVMDRK